MKYKDRLAHAQEIYKAGLQRVQTTPPPEGQKYAPGTRVKIADDLGHGMGHFISGKNATINIYTHMPLAVKMLKVTVLI